MANMETDEMDVDGPGAEVDQGRRHRAAQKLDKRMGVAPDAPTQAPALSFAQARELMKKYSDLYIGNKITPDNAFDLNAIDALRILIRSDDAGSAEGHFQTAGAGLDISMKIYAKRVDAVYNLTFKSLRFKKGEPDQYDDDDAAQGAGEGGNGDGDGPAELQGTKGKKRQAAASEDINATLVEDSALRQRVKEPTFESDPSFVRTSRLIDENSPQGLLLHNLMALGSGSIAFDPNSRPQEIPPPDTTALGMGSILIDLTGLPGVRELRAAALEGMVPLSPDIVELYSLLQPRTQELPGLKAAAEVDPQQLLRDALAENHRDRVEAHRRAVVRQVVQQVEDTMDVDMADADGGGDNFSADADQAGPSGGFEEADDGPGAAADAFQGYDDDGAAAGAEPSGNGGYDSPGYDGGYDGADGGSCDEAAGDRADSDREEATAQRAGGSLGAGDGLDGDGEGRDASDDESAMRQLLGSHLLGSFAAAGPSNSGGAQHVWWKSYARKKAPGGAAAKPRARRQKPEEAPLDWRAPPPEPQLEDPKLHTYKTTRSEASGAKLLLPQEEPARPEDLWSFFSDMPVTSCGLDGGGASWGGFGGYNLRDAWAATLMGDRLRERTTRHGARTAGQGPHGVDGAAPAAVAATQASPFGRPVAPGGPEPSMSDADGPYGDGAGGVDDATGFGGDDGYGDGGGYGGDNGGYDDDAGPLGAGGDDTEDDFQQFADNRTPTLEELLQPPRRVKRVAIKFDRTAGVADVATLKTILEESLTHLATNRQDPRQPAAADQRPLTFQSVLDEVSVQASKRASQQPEAAKAFAAAGRSTDPLAGVSPHLAFICLLHLANEKSLKLTNGGDLDTLMIPGLGDIVRLGPGAQ